MSNLLNSQIVLLAKLAFGDLYDRLLGRSELVRHERRRWRKLNFKLRFLSGNVERGPFVGMAYLPRNSGATYVLPKLLGTYELELSESVERFVKHNVRSIVVIGAAEGYFAVGLARRLAKAKVIAFEGATKLRDLLASHASLNSVRDRIEIKGFCAISDLVNLQVTPQCLVICDVEGAERELMEPQRVQFLRDAIVIVEVHEDLTDSNELCHLIEGRFRSTHSVQHILPAARLRSGLPAFPNFDEWEFAELMYERSLSAQGWLVLVPYNIGSQ
ncbi:MAG: hypothetical protein O3B38_03930 [Chloroflexi bacterium]|nr:hypothetical protein [Chloroflexota bacterium]